MVFVSELFSLVRETRFDHDEEQRSCRRGFTPRFENFAACARRTSGHKAPPTAWKLELSSGRRTSSARRRFDNEIVVYGNDEGALKV